MRSGGTAWGSGDPIALARHLDTLVRTVEADPALLEFTKPTRDREWKLPPGARPDDRNAIDWLARQPRPFTLVVDGYNVLFHLDRGDFSTGRARQRLSQELGRLKREAGTARVVVVYDSALPGGRRVRPSAGGVEVRFAEEDRLADEEVILLAGELTGAVVVVSSDREVREGAEAAGAFLERGASLDEYSARIREEIA